MRSRKETAEGRPSPASAEDYVQSGTNAEPGNGIPEQRIRVPEQTVGIVVRAGSVGNPGENLVSEPPGQRQTVGKNTLRPTNQVRGRMTRPAFNS